MAHSRKKFTAEKGLPKPQPNGHLRSKTKQALKDFINGKIDEDELDLISTDDNLEAIKNGTQKEDSDLNF